MWLNIYDADPLKSDCADKLKVKDYARRITGEDLGVPTLAVWDSADAVDFSVLPDRFVIKCNHGSGMNIIVRDKASIDAEGVRNRLRNWMNDDFAFRNGFESHYHWIERKMFAEPLLGEGRGELKDYKFWCFNGEPKVWTINDGNGHGAWMNFYDIDMNVLSYKRADFPKSPKIDEELPKDLDNMFKYAKLLSKGFKFVRVDFYEYDKKAILGEMTFTPGAFIFKFVDSDDNIKLGNMIEL